MLRLLVLMSIWLLAYPVWASGPVVLNFVNADIDAVIRAVGQIANKNFLIDPRVKGTINIASVKPVSPELAYQILVSALRMQGYAVVEERGVVKVLPESEAKLHGGRIFGREIGVRGDQVVTQVYPLAHASAAQLVPVLRPLIAPNNAISAYPAANVLVITDYAENLRRISQIIEAIDRPSEAELEVIRVEHLSAIELAQQLTRLFTESAQPGQQAGAASALMLAADARSNSLLVRSDQPGRIAAVRELVRKLDVPASGAGQLRVVHLRNADAVKLAETLRALAGAEAKAAPAQTGGAAAPGVGSGPVTILADAATNSLVIHAPEHLYNALRAVIERLDTRRAQVFVEALIVEVTSDKAAELGIQWQGPLVQRTGDFALVGGTNYGAGGNNLLGLSLGIATGQATQLPGAGLNLALLQRITLNGKTYDGLTALARALEKEADANILSTPNLLTLDNEEAKIVIGQNVPFLTGSYAQTGGTGTTVNPFQTIERRDVGLTLKVKPQVSEGGNVKLNIVQEVSSVSDSTQQGIITNKRAIETTVLVRDGEAIVLGGLIQDDQRQGMDKVPGLGDLPLLGGLFRAESRKRTKTNLMVFLRPVVVHDQSAFAQVTDDRYAYLNALLIQQPARSSLLGERPMLGLPDLKLDRMLVGKPIAAEPAPRRASDAPASAPASGWFD
jgi:general secretion pathway protein D